MKKKIIIFTVGGTPDPIVKTIEKMNPWKCAFICSRESVQCVEDVVSFFPDQVLDYKIFETESADNLTKCYDVSIEAVTFSLNHTEHADVSADITSGYRDWETNLQHLLDRKSTRLNVSHRL